MINLDAKTRLLHKRVLSLTFPDEFLVTAQSIVEKNGMTVPDIVQHLRREWLNDLIATLNAAEFRHAKSNPGDHFVNWINERSKNPFHVTYRAVDAATRRLGTHLASKLAYIVWPQEIAWAQRFRLANNPHLATRAAMFLREAEGNPAKLFGKIEDLYSEAIMKHDYSEHSAHEISPQDIRFEQNIPEFNPLFLRYAARSYSDVLNSMSRAQIELLAKRAAKDEAKDRSLISARKILELTHRFPMRRLLNVVSLSNSFGLTSNELYQMEIGFLEKLVTGEVELEQGIHTPHASFVAMLANVTSREEMALRAGPLTIDADAVIWTVANLDKSWLSDLPVSYGKWNNIWQTQMELWQVEIVEERRPAPFDLVSDFAYWLMRADLT